MRALHQLLHGRFTGFFCIFSTLVSLVSLVSLISLTSCSQNDVLIEKIEPIVEKVYEDHPSSENGVAAHTDWFFHCTPTFDYTILQSTQTKPGVYFVRLEIKRIQMKISLPIKVFLAKDATDFVVHHEAGHVSICETIYKSANMAAERSARKLIGLTFVANRPTAKEAQQAALDSASKALCTDYTQSTVNLCNRVSETYDVLAHRTPSLSVKDLVDTAFQISGKSE